MAGVKPQGISRALRLLGGGGVEGAIEGVVIHEYVSDWGGLINHRSSARKVLDMTSKHIGLQRLRMGFIRAAGPDFCAIEPFRAMTSGLDK